MDAINLSQSGVATPAEFFEVYGFHGFHHEVDTGLGEGFIFNNPLEPSPSTAHTGNQAAMAHHGDLHSLENNVECYSPWSETFLDGDHAFWQECVAPTFAKPKFEVEWGQEPEYSDLEEEVSVEETDSEEDRRPARSAWKKPVGKTAGSVEGEGEWASSGDVPLADTLEWQQDEDDEEFEDDDDEYERPARLSGAPAPTISSRKASAWSDAEDAACIKFMKEVCTLHQYAAIAGTEKRFEVVADRMKREAGFNRTASGVKLQWNRRLRAASGFEDRGEKKRASGLTTSALGQGTKRGTSAATSSVSSKPSKGTKSSATSARLNGKRKAIEVDSDDEDEDDDFISAPRPYPAKRPRIASASSSTLPSTQDVAYYDLSTDNILSGPRSSRHRPAATAQASTTTTTPARSSRLKLSTTTNDDAEDEEEAIPEPELNSKAYWQDVLRRRQAKLARQREEFERQQENEEESEDEEPVVTAADKARKSRELRKQKTSSTTKSTSTTRSSSATRPASTTRPTSATTTRPPPRRFDRLSPIAEDAIYRSELVNNNSPSTATHVTPATVAQIAADEEIARRMQEEWNEAAAPRARRGRGFR